jgi:periodic tryptophan protein 2
MRYNYQLKRSCGNIYSNGNLLFTSDGNTVLAPVGNRINVFNLIHQTTESLALETKKDIALIALSHNNNFLVIIDNEGYGLFFHFPRRILLHRFNFRRKVNALQFSPNDEYFAVTSGRGCQIWKTPNAVREFIPLKLLKTITGHYDETTSLDWSSNSKHLVLGSKDLTARVYFNVPTTFMSLSILVGHRDQVMGVYFAENDKSLYTIGGDGGIFVWKYSRITVNKEDSSSGQQQTGNQKKRKSQKMFAKELFKDGENDEDDEGNDDSEEEDAKETTGEDDDDDEADQLHDNGEKKENGKVKTHRKGVFQLAERHLLRDNTQGEIISCAFHKRHNLLVLGFSAGIFGVYEMPDCANIHRLSVSTHAVSSLQINSSGEWIALGIAPLGQLLVWEWKSESYILKQQGHSYGLNCVDISSEGQLIATGGDDGKVKIWNAFTGFCVITFKEHLGPITGVKFIGSGQGKAILSASLDGTIRAHDLLRYKNFRTLTSPQQVQFTSLSSDLSGEIVCAGCQDPFQIYIWSLQTGKLLEVLSGHEGPISCMAFNSNTSILASGSWDGTLKLWNVYGNSCIETFEHGCDILSVAFRPDGKEIACTATDGNIYFWNTDSGEQIKVIEGRRDLAGGRNTNDRKTKENLNKSKFFNSISYSSDGTAVLVGGKSKYICIYNIATGTLMKKFQLSHNRSLEGIRDTLRSDHLIDGVSIDNLNVDLTQGSENKGTAVGPGTSKHHKMNLATNSKLAHSEIMTYSLQFSNTGKEFAIVSTEGLQIYSLDHQLQFIPMALDLSITPENILKLFKLGNYIQSIQMAIILQNYDLLRYIIENIPSKESIELVVKQLDLKMLKELIIFLSEQLVRQKSFLRSNNNCV